MCIRDRYSSVSFGAGGLVGGLLSGWTWEHLGAALTFSLSSAFALVGLIFVALWVNRADLDDAGQKATLRVPAPALQPPQTSGRSDGQLFADSDDSAVT